MISYTNDEITEFPRTTNRDLGNEKYKSKDGLESLYENNK